MRRQHGYGWQTGQDGTMAANDMATSRQTAISKGGIMPRKKALTISEILQKQTRKSTKKLRKNERRQWLSMGQRTAPSTFYVTNIFSMNYDYFYFINSLLPTLSDFQGWRLEGPTMAREYFFGRFLF